MSTSNSTPTSSSPDGKIIFTCEQHVSSSSQKLLKFYEEKTFFDTVLIAANDCIRIPAHKIVLLTLSEYFWEIFYDNLTTSKATEVKLKEIEAASLKFIVDFMYSGSIELNFENIETILRGAMFLKIKNLIDGCCDFLEKNVNVSNCLNWLLLAKELKLSELREKSLEIVYTNFEEVTKKPEFLDLNKIDLKDLLFEDNPHGHLEEQVFLSLVAWIDYEAVNRQEFLFELLSMVRYQYLTPKFIVENSTSVSKTVESCNLILHWLKYHLSPESRTIEQQNLASEPGKEVSLQDEFDEVAAVCLNDKKEAEILNYNQALAKWSVRSRSHRLLTKKRYSSMIVIDEQLFLVGGIDCNSKGTNCVECVDLKTFKLTDLPPMQYGRYQSQLVNLDGHLCVFGGFKDYNISKTIESVEILNLSTQKWSILEPPCKPDHRNKIVGHNGILYIFDFRYGSVQCYDVSSNQWTSKKIPVDDDIEDIRMAAVGNFVYAICMGPSIPHGVGISYRKTIISCFDLSNNTWSEIAELPENDSYIEMVTVIGNKFLIHKGNQVTVECNLDTKQITDLSSLPYKSYIFQHKFAV